MTLDEIPLSGFVLIISGYDLAAAASSSVTIEKLYDLCISAPFCLVHLKEKQLHKLLLGNDKGGFIDVMFEQAITLETIEYLLGILPQVGCV